MCFGGDSVLSGNVRLLEWEIQAIKEVAEEVFGKGTKVFLFGSRVDPDKKGGDIDLYIIPADRSNLFLKELKFKAKLMMRIGEQKIDVVVQQDTERPIEKEALRTGVEL